MSIRFKNFDDIRNVNTRVYGNRNINTNTKSLPWSFITPMENKKYNTVYKPKKNINIR